MSLAAGESCGHYLQCTASGGKGKPALFAAVHCSGCSIINHNTKRTFHTILSSTPFSIVDSRPRETCLAVITRDAVSGDAAQLLLYDNAADRVSMWSMLAKALLFIMTSHVHCMIHRSSCEHCSAWEAQGCRESTPGKYRWRRALQPLIPFSNCGAPQASAI